MSPKTEITLLLQCDDWEKHLPNVRSVVKSACHKAIGRAGSGRDGAVSVVLADDEFVRDLNHTYRGKNKPTNILSFPTEETLTPPEGEELPLLGDMVLAYETVRREAIEQGKTPEAHLSHLLVHGCLHLLGFNHEEEREAEEMEALEIEILQEMNIANPY